MNQQTKIRFLAKKVGAFVTKELKIFDTRDKLTRVLIKHCKDENELLEYLEIMANNSGIEIEIKNDEIEITEKDLACLYSKTHEPMDHQVRYFQLAKDQEFFANFMEMGLGKSLSIVMEAGYLYEKGEINALVVIAPNGVHRQWVDQQIPEHLPDRFKVISAAWSSSANKEEMYRLNHILLENKGLKVLTINVEALGSNSMRAYEYLENFVANNKCMLVIDESTRIKNPKAKRTKLTLKLKKYIKYRRILSGLYIPNGPLDLYSQFYFLDPVILGFNSYVAFRSRYAVETNPMLKRELEMLLSKDKALAERIYNERRKHYVTPARLKYLLGKENQGMFQQCWKSLKKSFLIVQGYKNVEELSDKISKYSFRVLKDQCLDLAPKTYMSYESTLSHEQKRIYDELEKELISEINGEEVVIDHVLKKLTILRQVCGGTFKDAEGKAAMIGKKVPRMELLIEVLKDIDLTKNKVIIWACHIAEIEMITKRLKDEFGKEFYATVIGDIKGQNREDEFNRFMNDDECRSLVGTATSGGIGRNLTAGNYMIFYSNSHDLDVRRQAEDREHRKGQTKNVTIIDFITKGLIDEKTLKSLLSKQKLADQITRDPLCWTPNIGL